MFTYTGSRNYYGEITNDTSAANLTRGDSFINDAMRGLVNKEDWPFREASYSFDTVEGTQFYNLPNDCDKVFAIKVLVANQNYVPLQCPDRKAWDLITQSTTFRSSYPSWYYIQNGQVGIYPTPGADGNAVTVFYNKKVVDLSEADYATGTISNISTTTVTGSGTTWTSAMAGRYIKLPDKQWYKIDSVTSATVLEIEKDYQGTATSGTYTIGEASIIPEPYQVAPIYKAAEIYFTTTQPSPGQADRFKRLYDEKVSEMNDELARYSDPVIPSLEYRPLNPNLYVEL